MSRRLPRYEPGEIVLIPHAPFSNQMITKARPALIISTEDYNAAQGDVVCIGISSQVRPHDPYAVTIVPRDDGFAETGLKCASDVKCGTIFAYAAYLIRRKLGRLPASTLEDVRVTVRSLLGL